jgi:hypothetical protein
MVIDDGGGARHSAYGQFFAVAAEQRLPVTGMTKNSAGIESEWRSA